MTRRDLLRVGEPAGIDASFPSISVRPRTWFRAHTVRDEQPGTCYWASTELAAARERVGRPGDFVAHDEVQGVVVSRSRFPARHLADLLHVDASRRGVTAELMAVARYALTQRWAEAFYSAGFAGVHYRPRFSTDHSVSVALFGPTGLADPAPDVVGFRALSDVLTEHGYSVLPAPRASDLSLID